MNCITIWKNKLRADLYSEKGIYAVICIAIECLRKFSWNQCWICNRTSNFHKQFIPIPKFVILRKKSTF